MILKRKYSWKKFENLIGIQVSTFTTYIVNGMVYYICKSGHYECINSRPLGFVEIRNIELLGEEEDQEVVVIFIGKNRTQKALEYLSYISKGAEREGVLL